MLLAWKVWVYAVKNMAVVLKSRNLGWLWVVYIVYLQWAVLRTLTIASLLRRTIPTFSQS